MRSHLQLCRLCNPVAALFADPPPTEGECWTLQVALRSCATLGAYCSDTESPMIRQFGRVSEMGDPAPGEQHEVVPAKTQPER